MSFIDEKITSLHNGLVVSCHVDEEEKEAMPELLAYFVRAAERGGAVGIRIEGIENVRSIRPRTGLPIIGFTQGSYEDGSALITAGMNDVEALLEAGADIIAIDGTKRKRPDGSDGFLFFEQVRKRFKALLWADVATFREGIRAAESGADLVATTLAGYTPGTQTSDYHTPDFALIHELSKSLTIPVIAEGRIWNPEHAAEAIALGAHAVVVGSAITRPHIVAQMFTNALKVPHHHQH
ncbi:MAG: N-acetylmannosamine-6-phosphate 2-epimerase [Bacteroidetes bacterium]|nr:N-acetylmannosamine-6-phosphate 2-epimerase [Bacteroidota bacterium]